MQKNALLNIETMLTQSIVEYLDDAISFPQFLQCIRLLQKDPTINQSKQLQETITELLSLSQYADNPYVHKDSILTTIYQTVKKF